METPRPEDDALDEAPMWLIDNIAEASKNARSLYLLYLGFVAYCVLTLATTTDRQLILDEGVLLPVIGLPVPLGVFFLAAPFLAIVLFSYLQFYLQWHRGLVKDLRENFKPVRARRLYPWILNMNEDPEPGSASRLQRVAVGFVLWGLLPLALILFVFVSLKRHELGFSLGVAFLSAVGWAIAFYFWYQYARPGWQVLSLDYTMSRVPFLVLVGSVLALKLTGVGLLIGLAQEGRAFTVDLSYQVLITEEKEEYGMYWVDLSGRHLEGANLMSSVLRRADLSFARLDSANLLLAHLQEADLFGAHLQGAELSSARLDSANLSRAQLQGASLQGTQLQGADLHIAQLQGANLRRAHLHGADLRIAQLQGADLRRAHLHGANLQGAQLRGAYLLRAQLQGIQGLTLDQLCTAESLWGIEPDSLYREVEQHCTEKLRLPFQ